MGGGAGWVGGLTGRERKGAGGIRHPVEELFEVTAGFAGEAWGPAGFVAVAAALENGKIAPGFHQAPGEQTAMGPKNGAIGKSGPAREPFRPEPTPGIDAEHNRGKRMFPKDAVGVRYPGVCLFRFYFGQAHWREKRLQLAGTAGRP